MGRSMFGCGASRARAYFFACIRARYSDLILSHSVCCVGVRTSRILARYSLSSASILVAPSSSRPLSFSFWSGVSFRRASIFLSSAFTRAATSAPSSAWAAVVESATAKTSQRAAFLMVLPSCVALLEETGEEASDLRAGSLGDRGANDRGELPDHFRGQAQLGDRALHVGETAQPSPPEQRAGGLRDVTQPRDGVADRAELVRRELVLCETHH